MIHNDLDLAKTIAKTAFEGKTDLAGEPYVDHLQRVVKKVNHKYAAIDIEIIAWLHDILEDCPEWSPKLLEYFFYKDTVKSIIALTKQKDEDYEKYIERVAQDHKAKKVKIADLEDNMNILRLTEIKDKDVARLRKYLKAYQYLTNN